MIKQFILVIFILFLSSNSFAVAVQAQSIRTSQGETYLLCDEQTIPGIACINASAQLVAFVHGYNNLTFFFRQTGTGSTCQVYAVGHYDTDGNAIDVLGAPDLRTLSSYAMFSTPLSATQESITLTGTDFNAVFAVCTNVSGSSAATVEMRGSTKAPLR